MIDLTMQQYVDWRVKPVMKIRNVYGYRVVLRYADGSEKTQQKSGFPTKREASFARDITVAELHNGTYIVYDNVTVSELMEHWLEDDVKRRTDSNETWYSFSGIVKNHINPAFGKKKIKDVGAGDIQRLYNEKAEYSVSVARLVKCVINLSFRYALNHKFIATNPAVGINLPKIIKEKPYHVRDIDTKKTLTMEQILILVVMIRH